MKKSAELMTVTGQSPDKSPVLLFHFITSSLHSFFSSLDLSQQYNTTSQLVISLPHGELTSAYPGDPSEIPTTTIHPSSPDNHPTSTNPTDLEVPTLQGYSNTDCLPDWFLFPRDSTRPTPPIPPVRRSPLDFRSSLLPTRRSGFQFPFDPTSHSPAI